jgi:hypothetical protein
MQVVLVAVVGVLAWYAMNTNGTLCSFKRDLQNRRDASAAYLGSIESGARQLPDGFTLADLRSSLAARDATLRSLRDLNCSPG